MKNFASFKDSLCDELDEEANEELSAAAEVEAESSPASVDTESAPHTPSYNPAVGGVWKVDDQILTLCNDINDLKLSDSFLLHALNKVLAPFEDAPAPGPASDLPIFNIFDCSPDETPFCYSTTDNAIQSPVLMSLPSTDSAEFAKQSPNPSESSPSLFTPQTEKICESTSATPCYPFHYCP